MAFRSIDKKLKFRAIEILFDRSKLKYRSIEKNLQSSIVKKRIDRDYQVLFSLKFSVRFWN